MRAFAWAVLLLLLPLAARAQAPPLTIDSPATTPDDEFDGRIGLAAVETPAERVVAAPVLEAVYGLSPELELGATFALLFVKPAGESTSTGLGAFALTSKWRFLDGPVALAVAPALVFPVALPARLRLVTTGDEFSLVLPLLAERSFGPVRIFGEGGWQLVRSGPDGWFGGLAVGLALLDRLELLADVAGQGVVGGRPLWLGEVGFDLVLSDRLVLQASGGRWLPGSVPDEPRFIGYLGLQVRL